MRDPQSPSPVDRIGLPTVALLLHSAVPCATDHPYQPLASPPSTTRHLACRHHLDLEGEHAELFAEQFTGPDQLHRFAHEPTEQRAILALLLEPFVDQILVLLNPLPRDLYLIVLAEVALATRLLEGATQPASPGQLADNEFSAGSGPQ